ncbi:Protein of unknown function [Catalinimonas alkaloidigena]|uniref:DUF4230 domain-containing protein n=1 Tax=Catalinimonas alkaloidigena TaxID=1075417 RepID=A0A1G9E094_9BACT|nr:DUF4230 domain-containing protein [Catalinimonas alkaloidigena]SDK69545.1 Protein of unknown function [Catalinimonas alkaloidigena]
MLRKIIRWAIVLFLIYLAYYHLPRLWRPDPSPQNVTTTHHTLVEKIEALGRMELVRYHFTDVIDHEVVREWFLPNAQVHLLVRGEAIGCIDFAKLDSSDVQIVGDTVLVQLPAPEICSHRIDHQRSRVLDVEYQPMNQGKLVDEAYRRAEREILNAALKDEILKETEENADKVLRPMLETLSGRTVILRFAPAPVPIRPQ